MPDKIRDEAALRKLVDFRRCAHLHHLAAIHDRDPRRERHRLVLIVRHHDERDADLILQVHQLELCLLAQLLVERRQRLIQQQHLGTTDQRAGQGHALPLAAGELVRLALREMSQLHHVERFLDALLRGSRHPAAAA